MVRHLANVYLPEPLGTNDIKYPVNSTIYFICIAFGVIILIIAVSGINRFIRLNYPGKGFMDLPLSDKALRKPMMKFLILVAIAFAPLLTMAMVEILVNVFLN